MGFFLLSLEYLMERINIYSGTPGIGGALTNRTELSFEKGNIKHHYPITWEGVEYPDVESAYKAHKGNKTFAQLQSMMVDMIEVKFRTHPKLRDAVTKRGAANWLLECSHCTNARSQVFRRWEGHGYESPFIRCLTVGYAMSNITVTNGRRDGFVGKDRIYIGRENKSFGLKESVLCNPFPISESCSREESIQKFRKHLWERLKGDDQAIRQALTLIQILGEKGERVNLTCWCAPLPCHGRYVKRCVKWLALERLENRACR